LQNAFSEPTTAPAAGIFFLHKLQRLVNINPNTELHVLIVPSSYPPAFLWIGTVQITR
jgi:hypothetical protein